MADLSPASRFSERRPWLYAALLALLTLTAYSPVFHAEFIWDDDLFITDNPTLRSPAGLKTIWLSPLENPQYYPLLLTVFWLEFKVFGTDPAGYHVITLLFHIAAAMAFWRFARRVAPAGAAWCGLIFALHPLNVQSVAWVTELKNTMSGFFYLLALVSWDKFLVEPRSGGLMTGRRYLSAVAFFAAAVLTKTPSYSWVMFAALLGAYRGVGWRQWRVYASLIPMILFGAFVGWISVRVEHSGFGRGHPFVLTMAEQWVSAGKSLWFYLGKLFWPSVQMVVYPRWTVSASSLANWLPWLAAIAATAALWVMRKRWTIGPFLCWVFYLFAVAPIQFSALGINFIYLYSFAADHFAYLPLLSVLPPICVAVAMVLATMPPVARLATTILLIGSLVVLTFQHARTFQTKVALWSHNVEVNPRNGIAWMNLGYALSLEGRHEEEVAAYERVLEIDPSFVAVHNDMGLALVEMGRFDEARQRFEEALRLDPTLVEARFNLGCLLARIGEQTNAIPLFESVLSSTPNHLLARLNLAHALRLEGRIADAMQQIDTAILINDNAAEVWYERAMVFLALRDKAAASKSLDRALALRPAYPEARDALRQLQE